MKSIKVIVFLLLLLTQFSVFSQSLYEVPVEEITNNSSLIVEGKVVGQTCFWNTKHTMIYTENKILVYKSFKGSPTSDTIKVITVGGQVGNSAIVASDLLDLELNDFGLFYCTPNTLRIKSPQDQSILLDVYSSQQGFVKYDLNTLTASTPFKKYNSITNNLYQAVEAKTGGRFRTIHPWSQSPEQLRATTISALGISSFSPTTVNAGALLDPTNNLLTITGTDFGDASGSAAVYFDDSNDGTGGTPWTVAYNSPLIVSWSNTEIKIRVPERAGNGTVGVTNSTGSSVNSSGSLNVRYSVMTFYFTLSEGLYKYFKEGNLMNNNGTGGYTIKYSTNSAGSGIDLDASAAKATFQRALNTWKEISGYNITEGGTTTNQVIGDDGINTIMYDNTNTGVARLSAGTLGVCYSYFYINGSSLSDFTTNQAYKTGFDIIIRQDGVSSGTSNFTLGPCPPNATNYLQTDLETVLLHELGHSIGLMHINDGGIGSTVGEINPPKLMNYSVGGSTKRVSPDYSAYAGAAYLIQQQGNTYGGGLTEMIPLTTTLESKDNCPTTLPTVALAASTAVSFDMVHATSNSLTDPAYNNFTCDGFGASLTNNAYYAFKTGSTASSTLTITVSGYGTTPSALASCSLLYPGVPVTGFRLALYNVSGGLPTSPSGYGSPVACKEFSANGAISDFTGLAANTEYLLLVEGIENTKAAFNFTFTGTATASASNTAGAASSTPTLCINTALTNITHTTTGATGISNDNVTGANGLPAGVKAQWAGDLITISGTPTASGIFSYSIPLTGGTGSVNATGTITVTAAPTPTFTAQPGATACASTDVTYTTESGQTNYIWTVPGTLNTDYSITSGGVGTSSNTVTLKWLTAGSKTVIINYTSSGCTAASATSSTATTVIARPTPTFTAQPGATANASTDVTYTTQSPRILYVWSVPGTLNTDYSITSGGVGTSNSTVTLKWLTTGSKTVTINYTQSGCSAASATSSTATTVIALDNLGLNSSRPVSVAYSVRQLSTDYSGPLMRIQNSTSGDTYDVWPNGSGEFSSTSVISAANPGTTPGSKNGTTALSTIISSTTFTVAIWYDQSGNGKNLTQTTAANQPRIIYNGTIETENSKPFIKFYGSPSTNTGFNSLNLANTLTTNGHVSVVNKFASGGDGFILGSTLDFDWHSDNSSNLKLISNYASTSVYNSTVWQNGTSISAANAVWNTSLGINTIQPQTANSGTKWDNIGRDRESHHTSGGGGYAELVVFASTLSSTERPAVETSQATYFAIDLTNTPIISAQPSTTAQTLCLNGTPSNLSVTASVTSGTINYQWYSNTSASNTTGSIIAGETNSTYTPNTSVAGTTYYYCLLTSSVSGNTRKSDISGAVTVRAAFTSGAISETGQTICNGGTPTIIGSATASSGGDGTITYSWRSSADTYGSAIVGATSNTYTPPAGLTTTTSYRRYANDGTCNTTATVSSGTWTVTVNALPTPTFTAFPGSSACANTDQLYTTESGKTNYIWSVPGTLGVDYSITSGGIGTSSNTVTLQWLTTGSKTITINYTLNGCTAASATSSTATTIYASPTPTFTAQPGATACIGSDVTYTTQSGQDVYYWTIPGTVDVDYTITAGGDGTDNTVTLKWLTAGSKTVTINYTNSSDCTAPSATSSTATTVSALPTPTFTAQPGATACANTDVTYTTESGKTNYVWSVPGTLNTDYSITSGGVGTSSNTVTLKWLTAGSKTVTINYTSGGCTAASATSSTATTVSAAPTTANAGTDQTTCGSTSVTLAGNTPTVGAGAWSIVSGTGGTITTTSSPTSTFSGTAGATYTLRWTTTNGPCTSTDDVVITFSTAPTPTFTTQPGATACANTDVTYTTESGKTNYVWSVPGTLNTDYSITSGGVGTSSNTVTLKWLTAGSKTVTINYTSGGCTAASATSSTATTVSAAPTTANAGADGTTCEIYFSLAGNTPTVGSGTWSVVSGSGSVYIDDPSNPTSNLVCSLGTYTLRWTITNGSCTSTDDVVITFSTAPTAGITNNTAATELTCARTSISLTATGGGNYSWSNGTTVVGTSADLSVTAPATYTVTVTGTNGCTATSAVIITQSATPPTAGITNNSATTVLTCSVSTISLTATGGVSYSWSNGTTVVGTDPALSVMIPATYTVTVTGASGCTATSAVTITQTGSMPTIAIANSAATTELSCTATSITLTASGSTYYYWTKNGAIVSTSAALTVTTPGTYSATGTSGSGGCPGSNSVTITQNANLPVASITNNTGATQVDCINTAISLTATGGTSYAWSDGSTSANLSVTAAGTYTVTVTNSGSGCTSTSSIAITKNISASTAATLSGSTTISSGGTANLKVAITGGKAPFTITLSDGTVKTNYYPLKPTIAVSPTTTTSYTLVSVIGSNGCAGTGNSGTASVTVSTPGTTSWTGTVSRLWNVGGNWSAGTIPNENDAITIGTNANQPQLNIDFTVGGSLTLSGTGTTLTVNAGKSLSVASGATVDFGSKEVTFKSDATGTAQLGRMQGTLSNASNVVVERYFPATNRAYRFISASATTTGNMKFNWMENATAGTTAGYPFAAGTATNPTAGYGTQITGTGGNTNGFDASGTNNPSIFSLNNASQAWAAVANTSGTLTAGDAYRILIRGDRGINLNSSTPGVTATTLRTRGTLKTGTHTVSSLSSAWGGWNLIGNPYNAQIDMRAVSATNMTASYTVWDPTRGTGGAYVVFNYGTGVSSNIGSAVNELLQPGQAFFVQTENPGAATFTFEEVDKTPAGTQTSVFSPLNVYPVLNSALYYTDSLAKNKPEMDAFAVVFDNNFSDAIDREDGQKYGNTDENMSVNRNGSLLALELRSMYNSATIIPISITTYKRQNYTMRLKWNNPIDAGYNAKLVDNYNGTETAINFSGNTDYVYTVNSSIPGSIAADRFKIVFVPNAALPVSGLTLTGSAKGNAVALQYEALNEREMQVYEIERSTDGTVFTKIGEQQPVNGTSATNRYNYTDNSPLTGVNYYRIKGSSINGQLQYSNVITVKTGNLLPTVTVAPNPIANKVLNLKLSQLTKGSYRMTVTDVAGRTIFSKEMVYDGVSSAIKTSLPSNLKPGNYYVRLSGEGSDFTEKFIIQ